MIARIINGPGSIRTRSVEMFLATVMLLQGVIFLLPGDTLALDQWHDVRLWVAVFPGSEGYFGTLLVFTGTLRWAALIVNGKWYPTPGVRIAGCCIGSMYWASTSISFASTAGLPGVPASLAWTAAAVAFEIFSAVRAARDAYSLDTFGRRRRDHVRQRG